MIDGLKDDETGSPKQTSNNDNVASDEVADFYEAITEKSKARNEMENDPKEERNKKSYKDKMNIDIENINTIEKRNKVYTKNGGQSTKLYNHF